MAAEKAFVSALNEILAIAAIVVLVGAVIALALVRERDFHQPAPAPATAERTPPEPARAA